jgi:hypothetical protein
MEGDISKTKSTSEIAQAFASVKMHRTFRQFWKECWRDAWSHSWAGAGIMNLILSIIIPFAPMLDPHAAQHQAQWAWVNGYFVAIGTVIIAWIILLARLLIWAPYDTLKKIEAENKSCLEIIRQRFDQFHSALDDKLAKAEAQHGIAQRIILARDNVLTVADKPHEFLTSADLWNQETELFLANNLGGFASAHFAIPPAIAPIDLSNASRAGRQLILAKIRVLEEIAKNLDIYFRPIGAHFEKKQGQEATVTQPSPAPDKAT